MEPDTNGNKYLVVRWTVGIGLVVVLSVWLVIILLSSPQLARPRGTPISPFPELTGCTRLEIRYLPSALEYLFPTEQKRTLLNTDEIQYLQAPRTFTITDEHQIHTLAERLAQPTGTRSGLYIAKDSPYIHDVAQVTCRRNNDILLSFMVVEESAVPPLETGLVRAKDGAAFWYRRRDVNALLAAPEIEAFALREACADNLLALRATLRGSSQDADLAPTPERWCDDLDRPGPKEATLLFAMYRSGNWTGSVLMCPGAREGKCHYAMNSHWTAGSPSDIVFLFESQPGWNQHGGPELFTTDHHDPKGGCVVLNDGTVKFIRTEEELRQLRWK